MAYAANAGGVGTLEDVDDEEELETIASSGRGSGTGRQHLKDWWKPVLEMPFSDPEQDAPYWVNTNNVALRTPYPGILIKAFALIDSSRIQVYVAGTRRDNVRAIEDQLRMHREALLRELPPGTEIMPVRIGPSALGKPKYKTTLKGEIGLSPPSTHTLMLCGRACAIGMRTLATRRRT